MPSLHRTPSLATPPSRDLPLNLSRSPKNGRLSGITVGSHSDQFAMSQAIEAHGLKPVIDCSMPLEALGEAFRHQESQKHFGKICVEL